MALKNALLIQNDNGTTTSAILIDTSGTTNLTPLVIDSLGNMLVGTVSAPGADYAEYENNNGLCIDKGDIVGFKDDGTLTATFSEAIRFAVKSTDPAYVGGAKWSSEATVGKRPEEPRRLGETEDEWHFVLSDYLVAQAQYAHKLEISRLLVDRIAYAGKVPVNVQHATPGGHIIATESGDKGITGIFVEDPTFEQYKRSVGRVNRLLPDGRCEIAVIIH